MAHAEHAAESCHCCSSGLHRATEALARAHLSRRGLILGASTAAVGSWMLSSAWAAQSSGDVPATRPAGEAIPVTRIRKIYLAKPVPTWPKPSLDVADEIKRIEAQLAGMADRLQGIELQGGELYRTADQVPNTPAALGNPDGLLIFNLTSSLGRHIGRLSGTNIPSILFSQPYSGHDWSSVPALQALGHRIMCLATSEFGEIPGACHLVRTIHRFHHTRILFISNSPFPKEEAAQIREQLGPEIVSVGPERVNAAYREADEKEVEKETGGWIEGALKVIEPSRDDLRNSSRLYLALRRIMKEENAAAVTVNCLGLFTAKALPAYPCLAFCKLNDIGLTGVCEGDVDSTLTQLMFTYAFGVPGFVSDPIVDTATNSVIHAHCVSATRMDGPQGERAPYIIRSHLEDNAGASLQVKMRVGQTITMAKLRELNTMLISTGTITDNPDLDRGCRTKITTKVADARKVLRNYTGGLHRVIFYGDRVNAIKDLAALMKIGVVEEC